MNNVSVCMAIFNGEKHLMEQVESILNELSFDDELIIVDDGSVDNSLKIINKFKDSRIKVFKNNRNIGVNLNFEKALYLAVNELIFLADQDDVWVKGRLGAMKDKMITGKSFLISGNQSHIDVRGGMIGIPENKLDEKTSCANLLNLFKIMYGNAAYFGCCMGIDKKLLDLVLPFPRYIESHDLWIAICANLMKKNEHINDVVLKRRVHGENISLKKRNLFKKIRSRIINIVATFHALTRMALKWHI